MANNYDKWIDPELAKAAGDLSRIFEKQSKLGKEAIKNVPDVHKKDMSVLMGKAERGEVSVEEALGIFNNITNKGNAG